MTPDLATCLWFENGTEAMAAARFYTGLLPDSGIGTVTRYPDIALPEGAVSAGDPMVVSFRIAGRAFLALNGGMKQPYHYSQSTVIPCADQAEIDRLWAVFIDAGGQGGQCGWLTDRWGVHWQITPAALQGWASGPPARVKALMEEMMTMSKPDIARLTAAAGLTRV
ncbi:VOC family protein [Frigidibacter sp. MR17.14]|uniref:VOC family protein n=1 Tax=Frigidibacter sp. MR17.14 TaxID=3126509 RepID=UPI003012C180